MSLNILFLLIYLGFYIYIYKTRPILMVAFFYFFYGYLSMVVSVFYLDMGDVYVFELEKYSYRSSSLLLLEVFYLSTFLLYLFLYNNFYQSRLKARIASSFGVSRFYLSHGFIKASLIAAVIFIVVIIAHMVYSGVPLFLGYSKGQFWGYAKIPAFNILHNQTSTVLLVLGFFLSYIKRYRYNDRAYVRLLKYFKPILLVYLIYVVLMGYKFGGPLLFIYSFYMPSLVFYAMQNRFKMMDLFKYSIIVAALLIPVILYVYTYILSYGGDASQLLFDRIFALQGQVWHFVYNEINLGVIQFDSEQLFIEIKNIYLGNAYENSGINNLMRLIMPDTRYVSYLEGGVRLSGGYPANLLIIFDSMLSMAFVHIFFSFVIFVFHMNFVCHLCRLNLVRFVLWFKLALLSEGFLFMGDLNTIISIKSLVYLSVLLFIKFIEVISRHPVKIVEEEC